MYEGKKLPLAKTEGVVLHSRRQGEMTKILTLYTKAFGKISLVAKGARSTRSRFWGSLEPANHVHVVFYRKETRELQFLSQAEIVQPFLRLHAELGRMSLAMVVCEWVMRAEVSEAPNLALFSLLLETLRALDTSARGLRNVVRCFQMHFLELHGVRPELERCAQCGTRQVTGPVLLDVEGGRYFCAACRPASVDSVDPETILVLRKAAHMRPLQAGQITVSARVGAAVDKVLYRMASYHLEPLRGVRVPRVLAELEDALGKGQGSTEVENSQHEAKKNHEHETP